MATRRVEGAALLVAGHGVVGGPAPDAPAVHLLGQIGEALLATGVPWQIRRLTDAPGDRHAADRATLKRQLDELVAAPARVVVVVLTGTIVEIAGAPALVTGPGAEVYPEDVTLPLAWIAERLGALRAEHVVVVVSAHGAGSAAGWMRALATRQPHHLIAIEQSAEGVPVVSALLAGLCGEALDPRIGTVTMASLGAHLAAVNPALAIRTCDAADTIAQPPPLGGLWDVRRSQLSRLSVRRGRAGGAAPTDDLTGTVLPGRFRVDALVARGTFGTVYRARQLAVERDVALKVLHAEIDPASEDGRLFVHEIRSVGRIDHTSVVRIYQADITHDGRLFFAMELLDGADVQTLLAGGPLPTARAVALVEQLLAGLGAAHAAGLVHADIKPANAIVVTREGAERLVLVDFGLSRLRAPDRPAESAGGTPAYMAPEQLLEGRVDARSDLFSAALVLVALLTGWRRPNALTLTPPSTVLAALAPALRAVLARALAIDPAGRYATARAFAAALAEAAAPVSADRPAPAPGSAPGTVPGSAPAPGGIPVTDLQAAIAVPFRHLAPLTEADRGRLFGRDADVALLTEHALYRRAVICTAPSGVGKTSMLRAGLVPRLEALGVRALYHRVRGDTTAGLARAISEGATTIPAAIAAWHAAGGDKLVLVLDQLESALTDIHDSELVHAVLGFDAWPAAAEVAVVLVIREDQLARLVALTQRLDAQIPILRLPPLGVDGARDAIVQPLAASRLTIEPALLEVLLGDLQRAARTLAPEMGWGTVPAVYPPHLQLAGSVLYEALPPRATTLTLAAYRQLGGFDTIVGEHLERVLDTELAGGRDRIARDLFLALVTSGQERALRPEAELLEVVGARHQRHEIEAVLEALRARGLLVRVRGPGGEPSWELVHDSLVPRVLAWIDRRDLDRRKALELLRYHVRRSTPAAPSLLGRAELRELAPYADGIADLDATWRAQRGDTAAGGWTPARLVERSRQVLRRRVAIAASVLGVSLAVASLGLYRSHLADERAAVDASLRARDLGRFRLELAPFDWDPVALQAVPVDAATQPPLAWALHAPVPADPDALGAALVPPLLVRTPPRVEAGALVEDVEARGGPAILVVARPGCAPSRIPLVALPGYARRDDAGVVVRVRVPTCQATAADMITLAGGAFIYRGVGVPPSPEMAGWPELAAEQRLELPAFAIDRTEVTNAAFAVFASMAALTGIAAPQYPNTPALAAAGGPRWPVSMASAARAQAYCRFLGKHQPSSEQWTRALRGREQDAPTPAHARRNLPWGIAPVPGAARIRTAGPEGSVDVDAFPLDRTPEGVVGLAGNVAEWTSHRADGSPTVRGGNWDDVVDGPVDRLVDYIAIDNPRPSGGQQFTLGVRCVADVVPQPR